MVDPADAYNTAKAARDQRLRDEKTAEARAENFPVIARTKLEVFDRALKAKVPAGLEIETMFAKAGHLGKRGLSSLFFKLTEAEKVIAQGTFNVTTDEKVVPMGFPPDGDKRPERKFGEFDFDRYTPEMAIGMMGDLIAHYLK